MDKMNEIESYKDLPQESSFHCVSEPDTSIHRDPRTSKRFPSHNSSHKYHIQCLKSVKVRLLHHRLKFLTEFVTVGP